MLHPQLFEFFQDCFSYCCASIDRKSTRLNSSHTVISYAVFCLKKKKIKRQSEMRTPLTYMRRKQRSEQRRKPPMTRLARPTTVINYAPAKRASHTPPAASPWPE